MSQLLSQLLNAGLIEQLGGDDARFNKIEKASSALSTTLTEEPARLIPAILAALDPHVPADDPACHDAEQALVAKWKSMRSAHPDPPVNLYRAVLFDACIQASKGRKAAIVWLTAADTLRFARLGRESTTMRNALVELAGATESEAMAGVEKGARASTEALPASKAPKLAPQKASAPYTINRDKLRALVASSAGPTYRGKRLSDANPHSSRSQYDGNEWSWEFTDRMTELLATELEAVAAAQDSHAVVKQFQAEILQHLAQSLQAQQAWLERREATMEARQRSSNDQLHALWWSEALYSPTLQLGYRDLPLPLVAGVMAFDLASIVSTPPAASVGYLLAETVLRLSTAPAGHTSSLCALIAEIRQARDRIPRTWLDSVVRPGPGRLSIRDLFVLAIDERDVDLEHAFRRAALTTDDAMSVPDLAHAIFRQEQAYRLVKVAS